MSEHSFCLFKFAYIICPAWIVRNSLFTSLCSFLNSSFLHWSFSKSFLLHPVLFEFLCSSSNFENLLFVSSPSSKKNPDFHWSQVMSSDNQNQQKAEPSTASSRGSGSGTGHLGIAVGAGSTSEYIMNFQPAFLDSSTGEHSKQLIDVFCFS